MSVLRIRRIDELGDPEIVELNDRQISGMVSLGERWAGNELREAVRDRKSGEVYLLHPTQTYIPTTEAQRDALAASRSAARGGSGRTKGARAAPRSVLATSPEQGSKEGTSQALGAPQGTSTRKGTRVRKPWRPL